MKTILIFLSLIQIKAAASETINREILDVIAIKLNSNNTFESLVLNSKLDEDDKRLALEDIQSKNLSKKSIPRFKVKKNKLTVQASSSIEFDFSNIHNSKLVINNESFYLRDLNSYKKARTQLRIKFIPTKSSFNFIPVAYADIFDDVGYILGSLISSATAKTVDWWQGPIEERLILSYDDQIKAWEESKTRGYDRGFKTFEFTCNKTRLDSVSLYHQLDYVDIAKITFDKTKGYTYLRETGFTKCFAEADLKGDITSVKSSEDKYFTKNAENYKCPEDGGSIFDESPFFGFPKMAKECCETTGCYDKINDKIKSIKFKIRKGHFEPKSPKTVR